MALHDSLKDAPHSARLTTQCTIQQYDKFHTVLTFIAEVCCYSNHKSLRQNTTNHSSNMPQITPESLSVDISHIDGVKRNERWAQGILQSYARNICTTAATKTIYGDVKANHNIGESTFFEYISALEKLFIIDDIDAWSPAIRSRTAIQSSPKRNFIDPSIAVAAMGLSPDYFNKDFQTLGFFLKLYITLMSEKC